MKTKILTIALTLIISGTMAFAQSKSKSHKKPSLTTKAEQQKDVNIKLPACISQAA